MAEEMTIGPGGKPDGRARIERNGDAEAARTAREGDPFAAVGLERDVVAALRQLDGAHIAVEGKQARRRNCPGRPAARRRSIRLSDAADAPPGRRQQAALEARPIDNVRRSRLMANLHPWR